MPNGVITWPARSILRAISRGKVKFAKALRGLNPTISRRLRFPVPRSLGVHHGRRTRVFRPSKRHSPSAADMPPIAGRWTGRSTSVSRLPSAIGKRHGVWMQEIIPRPPRQTRWRRAAPPAAAAASSRPILARKIEGLQGGLTEFTLPSRQLASGEWLQNAVTHDLPDSRRSSRAYGAGDKRGLCLDEISYGDFLPQPGHWSAIAPFSAGG